MVLASSLEIVWTYFFFLFEYRSFLDVGLEGGLLSLALDFDWVKIVWERVFEVESRDILDPAPPPMSFCL